MLALAVAINECRSVSALGILRIWVVTSPSPGNLTEERSERIG